jgi:ABC-2 type transport system ATP-binding protein
LPFVARNSGVRDSLAAQFIRVSKEYRHGLRRRTGCCALDGVSFDVPEGAVFGLIGPNRAGKTTLVKTLLGLCQPTAGQVFRFGAPANVHRTLARVGYVHENQAFPRYWHAAGLLEYYGALAQVAEPDLRQRIPRLLELVGLADRTLEPIARFSKGMIQRLGLAQALVNDPDLLVLDEPTEGLDLEGRQLVRDIVATRRRQGRTALLVSHALGEIEALCDCVAVLLKGRLAYCGTLTALRRDQASGASRSLAECLPILYASLPS